jgi:hypothetical protein
LTVIGSPDQWGDLIDPLVPDILAAVISSWTSRTNASTRLQLMPAEGEAVIGGWEGDIRCWRAAIISMASKRVNPMSAATRSKF